MSCTKKVVSSSFTKFICIVTLAYGMSFASNDANAGSRWRSQKKLAYNDVYHPPRFSRRTHFEASLYKKRRRRRRMRRRFSCRNLLKRSTALRYIKKGVRLETALKRYIRALRRCKKLRRFDSPRVLVYDYRNCKMVALNQNNRTSAASLIKPFVMLAVYHDAYRRRIPPYRFSRKLQRKINLMMRVSNNTATNYLIKWHLGRGNTRRGLRKINKILRRYGLTQTRLVELIPRGGRTYKNRTSARNLSMLLYKIYQGSAVSKGYSRKMLKVMLYSRDNRGRTAYLRTRYGLEAATKTGYTRRTNGVAGIVLGGAQAPNATYNFVAILTRPLVRANEWTWRKLSTKILQRISEMTYKHYTRKYADKEVRRYGGRRARSYCRR